MPLICPRCQIAQGDENKTCINCGEPLHAAATPVPKAAALISKAGSAPLEREPLSLERNPWKTAALILAGLLVALCGEAFLTARRAPSFSAARPVSAPAIPVLPAKPELKPAPETMPLTVTLASTSEGRHVKVGSSVTLTAFTTIPHGQSATITLFSQQDQRRKTILSFAQGSLCSTTWAPPAPGHYVFSALVLDEQRHVASSRSIEITADGPAHSAVPVPVFNAAPRPVFHASSPPPKKARLTNLQAAKAPLKKARPASLPVYHVAAAHFPFFRNAAVLAYALQSRGYPAVTRRVRGSHGEAVYVVETGAYHRAAEAHQAVVSLQRSGYPAYTFGSR